MWSGEKEDSIESQKNEQGHNRRDCYAVSHECLKHSLHSIFARQLLLIERSGSGTPGQWCPNVNRDAIPALPAAA
jgi:hypothetical protein